MIHGKILKINCFNSMKGSNPSKKSRNDDILLDKCTTYTIPDMYEEPRAYRAPRPKRYVFRLVPEEPHQCVTTHTGQKLFIRLKSEESLRQRVSFHFLHHVMSVCNQPLYFCTIGNWFKFQECWQTAEGFSGILEVANA